MYGVESVSQNLRTPNELAVFVLRDQEYTELMLIGGGQDDVVHLSSPKIFHVPDLSLRIRSVAKLGGRLPSVLYVYI